VNQILQQQALFFVQIDKLMFAHGVTLPDTCLIVTF
jgi:hypothetical protein